VGHRYPTGAGSSGPRSRRTQCEIARLRLFLFVASCLSNQFARSGKRYAVMQDRSRQMSATSVLRPCGRLAGPKVRYPLPRSDCRPLRRPYRPISEIGPLPRFGGQLHHVKPRFPGVRTRAGRAIGPEPEDRIFTWIVTRLGRQAGAGWEGGEALRVIRIAPGSLGVWLLAPDASRQTEIAIAQMTLIVLPVKTSSAHHVQHRLRQPCPLHLDPGAAALDLA
jgi:hypothetical protein